MENTAHTPCCAYCLHLMDTHQTADGVRRCRVYGGLPVSVPLEDDCRKFVREVGSDDAIPVWYSEAWCVTSSTEGRGD